MERTIFLCVRKVGDFITPLHAFSNRQAAEVYCNMKNKVWDRSNGPVARILEVLLTEVEQ